MPDAPAAWASETTWLTKGGVVAGRVPAVHVEARNLARETGEVAIGHVARSLRPLLVVEELGEIPEAILFSRGESRDLLDLEGTGIPRRGLKTAIDDLYLAAAHVVCDQPGEAVVESELTACRALEVAVVDKRDGRLGIAEARARLRDPGEQLLHLVDGLLGLLALL